MDNFAFLVRVLSRIINLSPEEEEVIRSIFVEEHLKRVSSFCAKARYVISLDWYAGEFFVTISIMRGKIRPITSPEKVTSFVITKV